MSNVTKIRKEDFPVNLIEAIFRTLSPEERIRYNARYKGNGDVRATLKYVVGTLSERFERILLMRYKEALPYSEIAKREEITPSRVQQIVAQSERKIRERFTLEFVFKGVREYHAECIEKERSIYYEIGKNETIAVFRELDADAKENFLTANSSILNMPFEEYADRYNLSTRLRNCINRCQKIYDSHFGWRYSTMAGEKAFNTVGDIVELTEAQAMTIRNLGSKVFNELKEALRKSGLSFRKENIE